VPTAQCCLLYSRTFLFRYWLYLSVFLIVDSSYFAVHATKIHREDSHYQRKFLSINQL
jgi:hypothetical protein